MSAAESEPQRDTSAAAAPDSSKTSGEAASESLTPRAGSAAARESVPEAAGGVMSAEKADADDQASDGDIRRRQHLEHHLRSSPTDRDGYLELARIYRKEQRPLEAQRVLTRAYEVFPEDEQLLWELEEANLARSLQKLREVRELAQRLQTAEADYELERSRSDWARRRIEVCRARLGRDASLKHLHLNLAEAFYDAGDYREAIAEVEPVLHEDRFSCPANLLIGRCRLAMGEDVEAMPPLRAASLRRALVAPPRIRVAALRLLCDTAERLGLTRTLERYRQQLVLAERSAEPSNP